MEHAALLDHFRTSLPAMLDELRALVEHESPSGDVVALNALGKKLRRRLTDLGAVASLATNEDGGGDHVVAIIPSESAERPVLILGHFDTVWPVGTLGRMPIREQDGRLYGPGVFDMKANLVMVVSVLQSLAELKLKPSRPIHVLLTADEEVGSPHSRPLIEEMARAAAYVLVVEPPLMDGGLKTARKGVGRYNLEVRGRAAHAGVAPETGASAVVELAHQILKIHALNDPAAGTTVNIGVVRGGTTANVVPAEAAAQVDVRVTSQAAADHVERELRQLRAVTPGTQVILEGRFNRPPMERTPGIVELFDRARTIARGLGIELTEGSTGGGSDGNLTAALGVPTLDGLGVRGGGAHADDEHILIDSLPQRAALLAALILGL
ncbi:MAG: M20 family metallopeptidase [Isosphaeraceae bacterium]